MAKQTTPKAKTTTSANAVAAKAAATTTETAITEPKIEAATVQNTAGSPTPPAMGNEGTAAAAGEGQPSLANPDASRVPEDGLTLSEAMRAVNAAILASVMTDPGDQSETAEPSLIVTGPKKGRWRIGRKFGREPVTLPMSELTEDDLQALAADPALTVTTVAAPY